MATQSGFRLLIDDQNVKRIKRLALDRGVSTQKLCRDAVMALLDDAVPEPQENNKAALKLLPAPSTPTEERSDESPLSRLSKRDDTLALFLVELARLADSDPRWGGK